MAKVFDCFIFYNELDLLEIRLNELNDLVDTFVICESELTFQGNEKPMYFLENRDRFSQFMDKIEHIHVKKDVIPQTNVAFHREHFQRNYMKPFLYNLCEGDDIILFTDADEIIKPWAIREYIDRDYDHIYNCCGNFYFLYLNNLLSRNGVVGAWEGPKIGKFQHISGPKKMMSHMRSINKPFHPVNEPYGNKELTIGDKYQYNIDNASWHFTFLGDVELKVNSYSHTGQRSSIDKEECVLSGEWPWPHKDNMRTRLVYVDDSYPQYLLDNLDKFSHHIYGHGA